MNTIKQDWIEKVSQHLPQMLQIKQAKASDKEKDSFISHHCNTLLLSAPEDIQIDKDVAFAAITIGKELFFNLHSTLLNDKKFISDIYTYFIDHKIYNLKQLYFILSEKLKEDVDIVQFHINVFKNDWNNSQYKKFTSELPKKIALNKSFIIKNILDINLYDIVIKYYKEDTDVLIPYLFKNPKLWTKLNKVVKSSVGKKANKEFIMYFLKKQYDFYSLIDEKFQLDSDIIKLLFSIKPDFELVPKELLKNKEFVKEGIQKFKCNLLSSDVSLHNDRELIKLNLNADIQRIQNKESWMQDPEFIKLFLEKNPPIWLISFELLQHRETLLNALKSDDDIRHYLLSSSENIQKIRDFYKNDMELLKILISSSHFNQSHINYFFNWQKNDDICHLLFEKFHSSQFISPNAFLNEKLLFSYFKKINKNDYLSFFNQYPQYLHQPKFIYQALNNNLVFLKKCPLLKADKDFVFSLLPNKKYIEDNDYSLLLDIIDPSLLLNQNIMSKIVQENYLYYENAGLSLKNNLSFISTMIKDNLSISNNEKSSYFYKNIFEIIRANSTAYLQPTFYDELLKCHSFFYKHIPFDHILKNDVNIIIEFIACAQLLNISINLTDLPEKIVHQYNINSVDELKSSVLYEKINNVIKTSPKDSRIIKI